MPSHSPTHVIHQLRTSPHEASLTCEHKTYEPTLLVSPHESIRIWTSLLISSRVHHHPWTYPLMTQHPRSKYRIIAWKQYTQATNRNIIAWHSLSAAKQNLRIPLDSSPSSLGSRQTHCFRVYRLANHTLPLGATRCRDLACWSYRLAHTPVPPGAISVAKTLLDFSTQNRLFCILHNTS